MPNTASLRCARCANPLLVDVTPRGVVTLDGKSQPFRRHTDYVMCGSCLASYPVVELRAAWTQAEASTRSKISS